jgi:hypothetical protein
MIFQATDQFDAAIAKLKNQIKNTEGPPISSHPIKNPSNMKKASIIILLFTVISLNGFSQNVAKDTVEIRRVLTDFFEVFTNPDMKHFDRNCVPTFELYDVGEIWNVDTIRNYVKTAQSQPKEWLRTNRFDFIKFNFREKIAWVSYHNYAHLTNAKSNKIVDIHWLESIILEKIKGKWWLVQMHSTRIK